jgi:acyl-CoA thioesterase-1
VVFPLPDGPTIATNAPGSTSSVISFSTVSGRPAEVYVLVREAQRSMGRIIYGSRVAGLVLAVVIACGGEKPESAASRPAAETPSRDRERVVFLGTSLTAGYGLADPSQAYPALIQHKIDSAGMPFEVVNAGVSGETSAGARRRIEWVLKERPTVLVIETGANDGLRGQNTDSLSNNIQAIVDRASILNPKPRIVIAGMQMLSNYGADYTRRFAAVYPAIARRNDLPLIPFLLEGVAGVDSLNQPDQIHPTAAGQRIIAETVWKTLGPVLQDIPVLAGR